jgi:MoaA/NifB/PqqE/SkfB family radical SAM enzyme
MPDCETSADRIGTAAEAGCAVGPTGNYRVVQIHPTLRCNLRCLHCYSSSSPESAQTLAIEQINDTLTVLAAEGITVASFSGGEPLMYRELGEALRHARSLGLTTTVTTNGMLLDTDRAAMLRDWACVVAVSIDGKPASHNELRVNPRAFEITTKKLQLLRDEGVPFGIIFTLTMYNLDELEWVASYAAEQGAGLLQIHPLEETGRAEEALARNAPDDLELAHAFVAVSKLLKQYRDRMLIQFDVVDRENLSGNRSRVFADPVWQERDFRGLPLGNLVSPIVLRPDGVLMPIQYNFADAYRIASIGAGPLAAQFPQWKEDVYPRFLALTQRVYREIMEPGFSSYPILNWYDLLARCSAATARSGAFG